MRSLLRSLRVRFAVLTFAAIYLPVVILFTVSAIAEQDVKVEIFGAAQTEENVVSTTVVPTPVVLTALGLAPFAAAAAWWLSGRTVRPVEKAIAVQGQLVAEASHELRTPLAVLINNAQVLLAYPEPTMELYREGLERSAAAANRMSHTIDALLVDARSRARTITHRPLDLSALTAAVAAELRPMAAARAVSIEVRSPSGPVEAPVDEPSVRRALRNVMTNAVEHSPKHAVVAVEVAVSKSAVQVAITDDGPGVAPEDREHIFDRFWTGRLDGTGLGLPMARQIVEAHGGRIEVTSPVSEGSGARFTLHLRG